MQNRFFSWLDKRLSKPYRHAPIIDREAYHQHPELRLHHFGNAETIYYPQPKTLQALPDEFANVIGTRDFPQPFVVEVQHGQLRGRHALAMSHDRQVIIESLLNHRPYLESVSAGRIHYPRNLRSLLKQVSESSKYASAFVLCNQFGNAYFHWMLESLPRIYLLKQLEAELGEEIPVIIDSHPPRHVRESLRLLGVKKVIEWEVTSASVERLFVPMALHGTGIPSGNASRWIAEQLKSQIDLPALNTPYIYISRKTAQKRRVINEEDVLGYLSPLGFHAYDLEKLSLAEQIALFHQAQVIIGAHGAGFSNAMFSRDAKLIEFFEPSYLNACYMRLAAAMGFDYGLLFGEGESHNIHVDVRLLGQLLQQSAPELGK